MKVGQTSTFLLGVWVVMNIIKKGGIDVWGKNLLVKG